MNKVSELTNYLESGLINGINETDLIKIKDSLVNIAEDLLSSSKNEIEVVSLKCIIIKL